MRVFIGCVAVLALACGVSAGGQAKIDGKLLIGKWEPVPAADKKEKAPPMVIEFQTGGKMILIAG